ncbi:uncharacterized protein Z518_06808 [Rhinocladiella mackenziei CBS 650.93]|uniref:Uncharacterized protein n=1 Tax=Rhinocladiella mackenziei CBS 650.93 TaxID=1442369 RepID=A0A0D2IIZ8_9EURO|nr:uncharacterized protein Z518_06808 [Rhinocladiella mackenziei CBS 650.93]KIX03256.1 hypothetical protein Z518_06808 [Rhinocladiella mackenziei CBS 650.93]
MPTQIETDQPSDGAAALILARLSQAKFDPIDFLNESLPTINLSSQSQTPKTSRAAHIQSASTDSLALLSSLNAHNIRASSDLSSLTDEIIRSGNRLVYEVEVLRGDVNGLHELLTESLQDDIGHFVQEEVVDGTPENAPQVTEGNNGAATSNVTNEPDFMIQLRLLGKVKVRLESVIAIFGEAMKWPMPPSELSMASSLISVSSPELGMQSTAEDDKAREILKSIKEEIIDLLGSDAGGYAGLEAASQRVEEYRQLAMLWKGTGEEKARNKFVDSLAKVVEDRKKALDGRATPRHARPDGTRRSSSAMGRNPKLSNEGGGAAGLFRNLQRLKDDLYLE